jgi:tetratricopeptide (TPR) repeat protein
VASQIELAKIQYAMGNYNEAIDMLDESGACRKSDEACYFQGVSAVLVKRFDVAEESLSRVKSGKFRPWAYISLAEVEMELDNGDEACRKYRSMSRSLINPTAMYRYGECLEKQGESAEAAGVFEEIMENFEGTPEALLAAEKLQVIRREPAPAVRDAPPVPADAEEFTPLATGYTLQFGSFQDRANAIKLASRLKRELPGIRIDSDLLNFKEVHRVRFGYFRSRADAQRKADEISNQVSEPCAIMTLP